MKLSKWLTRALTVATFVVLTSPPAVAQPNAPDQSLGTGNGRVTLPPFDEVYSSSPHALALLPDGRMVIAGNCSQPYSAMCFIRLLTSGAPDPEFGINGRVIAVNDDISSVDAIAVQSDGKLVASGLCFPTATSVAQGCVRRYLSSGAVDTAFGNSGRVNISITALAPGALKPLLRGRLTITAEGNIILSGICDGPSDNNYLCVVRLVPSGAQDMSFGAQGSAVVAAFPGIYIANTGTAVVQPDGYIVMAGDCGLTVSLAVVPCLTRLTATGAVTQASALVANACCQRRYPSAPTISPMCGTWRCGLTAALCCLPPSAIRWAKSASSCSPATAISTPRFPQPVETLMLPARTCLRTDCSSNPMDGCWSTPTASELARSIPASPAFTPTATLIRRFRSPTPKRAPVASTTP